MLFVVVGIMVAKNDDRERSSYLRELKKKKKNPLKGRPSWCGHFFLSLFITSFKRFQFFTSPFAISFTCKTAWLFIHEAFVEIEPREPQITHIHNKFKPLLPSSIIQLMVFIFLMTWNMLRKHWDKYKTQYTHSTKPKINSAFFFFFFLWDGSKVP